METVTRPQRAALRFITVVVLAALVVNAGATLVFLVAVATIAYLASAVYRLRLFIRALTDPQVIDVPDGVAAAIWDRTLPTYTILVPAYREPEVIRGLLRALDELDYPVDRLDIKLLLEADDGNWYVVKFRNNPQHRRILVNELVASVFLDYLRITAPPAARLRVTPDFLEANPDAHLTLGSRRIAVEPGWHFGSRYPGDPARTDPARGPLPTTPAPAIPRDATIKAVETAVQAGYDYLKVVLNTTQNGPEVETLKLIVAEGKKHNKPTIVHAVSVRDTLAALEAKPDLLVHTPHIAGRTRDANLRTADLIVDDFARVLRGEGAHHALTAAAIGARVGIGSGGR